MNATYTPGPWFVCHGPTGVIRVGARDSHPSHPEFNLCDLSEQSKEAEGNARLIAFAPEILEALQALLDWGRDHTSPRDANSPHQLLIKAAEAIAKATGKEG